MEYMVLNADVELSRLMSLKFEPGSIASHIRRGKFVIYGAGNLGEIAYDFFKKNNVTISLVVDRDKKNLRDIVCVKPSEVPEKVKQEYLWIICISTVSYKNLVRELNGQGISNVAQFYTVAYIVDAVALSNGWFFREGEFEIENAISVSTLLSHDEMSVAHYLQFLYWKKGNIEKEHKYFPVAVGKKYLENEFMPKLSDQEVYMDVGCFRGGYIDEFIRKVGGNYRYIIGIEPDPEHKDFLRGKYADNDKIQILNVAVSDSNGKHGFSTGMGYANRLDDTGTNIVDTVTIDSLKANPTVIKIHIEGEEYAALCGSRITIEKNRPILMVLADHNLDGYYKIPNFVNEIQSYKLYFRLHHYCGNSAVFYFMPEERLCNG